jgi:hypothetical protein
MNNLSQEKREEFDLLRRKNEAYLKLITIAICETTFNRGTLRKQIWSYLQQHFATSVDYWDFLLSIQSLEKVGKLVNKQGYFFV